MKRLLLLALFAVGCADEGGPETVTSPLAATEWSGAAPSSACTASVSFGASDFTWRYDCTLPDGSGAGSIQRGTYVVNGDSVTTTAKEATCAAADLVLTLTDTFSVDADALTLSGGHGVFYLPKGTSTPSTVVGCFQPGGTFVARQLAPL